MGPFILNTVSDEVHCLTYFQFKPSRRRFQILSSFRLLLIGVARLNNRSFPFFFFSFLALSYGSILYFPESESRHPLCCLPQLGKLSRNIVQSTRVPFVIQGCSVLPFVHLPVLLCLNTIYASCLGFLCVLLYLAHQL
jgi:hypothetical protein